LPDLGSGAQRKEDHQALLLRTPVTLQEFSAVQTHDLLGHRPLDPGLRGAEERRGLVRQAEMKADFQLRQPNEASPLFRTAEAGIEWAVAEKVVALHGGELLERNEGPEEKSLVIFLPLCP